MPWRRSVPKSTSIDSTTVRVESAFTRISEWKRSMTHASCPSARGTGPKTRSAAATAARSGAFLTPPTIRGLADADRGGASLEADGHAVRRGRVARGLGTAVAHLEARVIAGERQGPAAGRDARLAP